MKPTKEQERKVLEWCGVNRIRVYEQGLGYTWVFPHLDLTTLTRHVMPKVLEEYNIESYSFKQTSGLYYSETSIWREGSKKHRFNIILHDELIAKHFEQGTDLEEVTMLALFWAVHRVIEVENE